MYICICIFDRYNQVCKPRLSLDGFTHGSKPNNNNKISTIRTSENEDNTFSMYSNMTCQVPYSERSINSSTDAIDRREGATFFTVSHASSSPSFSCCEYILLCHTFDIEGNLLTWETHNIVNMPYVFIRLIFLWVQSYTDHCHKIYIVPNHNDMNGCCWARHLLLLPSHCTLSLLPMVI